MIILPAIDIKDGNCVRLYKGDFATAERVADDYLHTARSFSSDGAKWIHMVDLDGAKEGKPVNSDIFIDVAQNTGLKVELGGGIRNLDTVEYYISKGISRVILGSIALKKPEIVIDAVKEYSDRIAVGIDSKNGMAAAEGWLEASEVDYIQLALQMIKSGVKNIIFTDISKDGTLSGVNLEQLGALKAAADGKCNIIASGGVHTISDITACKGLGLYGVICGKSIYSGTLNLKEAIRVGEGD